MHCRADIVSRYFPDCSWGLQGDQFAGALLIFLVGNIWRQWLCAAQNKKAPNGAPVGNQILLSGRIGAQVEQEFTFDFRPRCPEEAIPSYLRGFVFREFQDGRRRPANQLRHRAKVGDSTFFTLQAF
jgi:hypothetical protein